MESREDCLREASECDRLANLANTRATRALLALAAFQWRKLADKAAERQKPIGHRCRKPSVQTRFCARRVWLSRGVRTPAGSDPGRRYRSPGC